MANVAGEGAAAPAPPKKDGGFGLGQAAGYGTLYNSRFEEPFRTAVRHIVETDLLPDEMSKTVIAFHLNKLCSSVFVNIEDCYKEALKKNELWTSSSKSYSLTNTFCINLYCDLPEQAPPPPAPAASRSPSPVRLPPHGVGLGKDRALQMRREELSEKIGVRKKRGSSPHRPRRRRPREIKNGNLCKCFEFLLSVLAKLCENILSVFLHTDFAETLSIARKQISLFSETFIRHFSVTCQSLMHFNVICTSFVSYHFLSRNNNLTGHRDIAHSSTRRAMPVMIHGSISCPCSNLGLELSVSSLELLYLGPAPTLHLVWIFYQKGMKKFVSCL